MKARVAIPCAIATILVLTAAALEVVNSKAALTNTFFVDDHYVKAPISSEWWRRAVVMLSLPLNGYIPRDPFVRDMDRTRYRAFRFVCLMYLFSIVTPWLHIDEGQVSGGKWAFVWLSTVLNLAILSYHATTPTHPKFRISPVSFVGLNLIAILFC
jgi:hypothetical protein